MSGEPAVLPFRPGHGWRTASKPRRSLAVATAAFAVLWCLLLLYRWPVDDADLPAWFTVLTGAMTLTVLLGGPFGCYATGRVLRPHPAQVSGSRRARHLLAAVATAYGLPLLSAVVTAGQRGVPLHSFSTFWICLLLVPPLTAATVAWGISSALARR